MREGLVVKLEAVPGVTDNAKRWVGVSGDINRPLLSEPYIFQCPPLEEFGYEAAHAHTDYDTVREGQFSRRGGPQLKTASFDTLVVDQGSFTISEDRAIEELVEELLEICDSGTAFQMIVAHYLLPWDSFVDTSMSLLGPELDMMATLRSVRVVERAGEGDARYINASFTEYEDPVVGRHTAGRRPRFRRGQKRYPARVSLFSDGSSNGRTNGPVYTVVQAPAQTTLASLARFFYGDANLAWHVAAHNDIRNWGPNTALIHHPRFRHAANNKLAIPQPPSNWRRTYDTWTP